MKPFTSPRTLGAAVALLGLSSFAALGGACSSTDTPDGSDAEHLGAADQHLILGALCPLLAINGKVQICHHTGDASYPYTILKTSVQACIHGHSGHAHDYIAVLDPTCHGEGCLPVDAPCDANVPCCDGLTCQNGTCTDLCAGVTCAASDACHAAGTCDPATGLCSNPVAADGTACDDGDGCTVTDSCAAGTCAGSGTPCQNGGTCDPGEPYTCTCPAGFTGPSCETPACVPTTCAAQGATCGAIPDGCGETLDCGSCAAGSTCEDGTCQPSVPECPCEALPGWLDFVVSGTECINYSGEIGDVYLYLKDTGSSRGIAVNSAIEESLGTPGSPALCGVVGPNNVGNAFIMLDTEDQVNACVQSLSNVASAGGVPCP
ncbi:calcium-binding EGF-like domain-containing protein [Sorangium sp. So ce291]|uniref:calcium-binding EGF-like domain-containing protein n=1 Tax=Sorangium sp. So ce291 TaxID=3133294 RepID=UPI003F64617B